jgi:predicted nucleic acid-binding protein
VRCLDATFLIDYLAGERSAVEKAKEWESAGERLASPAPAIAETLLGANFEGGSVLREGLAFLDTLDVLSVDASVAAEAGRMGAEQMRRGTPISVIDLLIAATARVNQGILVTRDSSFGRIPGLAVETY